MKERENLSQRRKKLLIVFFVILCLSFLARNIISISLYFKYIKMYPDYFKGYPLISILEVFGVNYLMEFISIILLFIYMKKRMFDKKIQLLIPVSVAIFVLMELIWAIGNMKYLYVIKQNAFSMFDYYAEFVLALLGIAVIVCFFVTSASKYLIKVFAILMMIITISSEIYYLVTFSVSYVNEITVWSLFAGRILGFIFQTIFASVFLIFAVCYSMPDLKKQKQLDINSDAAIDKLRILKYKLDMEYILEEDYILEKNIVLAQMKGEK